MAEKQDAFTKATEAAAKVIHLDGVIKEAQAHRKIVRAELAKHKKAVLVAMGSGKVRAPRKVKAKLVEVCQHGTSLPGYCQDCQDEALAPTDTEAFNGD